MGRLTTHVLDIASGRPAAGMRVTLSARDSGATRAIATIVTNADGRCDKPLLEGEAFRAGFYELSFDVGAYFAAAGARTPDPPFLDIVPIRFAVADPSTHYHVPLLVSPWSYSTYRGS